jgi:biotin carboxyl carrier protein
MKERISIVNGARVGLTWTESESFVEATVDGRSYRLALRRMSSGAYWFGFEGHSYDAIVVERDGGFDVRVDGHAVRVEFLDSTKARRRSREAAASGVAEVRAPMPGKIVRVLTGAGVDVQENQGVVIMEAMKMQNEIRSPKRGRILDLKVSEGDAVGLGDLIARVE